MFLQRIVKFLHRTVNLDITKTDIENRKIVGYAAVFEETYTQMYDAYGDVFYERVRPGAFKESLEKANVCMLVNHDWSRIVGRMGSNLKLEEDEAGLKFELDVPNTTEGNDLLENVRLGIIQGCSFGFYIERKITRWNDDWEYFQDLEKVELLEVTATPIPAYESTSISARSKLNIAEMRDKEKKSHEQKPDFKERSMKMLGSFFDEFLK